MEQLFRQWVIDNIVILDRLISKLKTVADDLNKVKTTLNKILLELNKGE